jgi:hypothetical protein
VAKFFVGEISKLVQIFNLFMSRSLLSKFVKFCYIWKTYHYNFREIICYSHNLIGVSLVPGISQNIKLHFLLNLQFKNVMTSLQNTYDLLPILQKFLEK